MAVKLDDGADPGTVAEELRGIRIEPQEAGGATTHNQAFLGVLAGSPLADTAWELGYLDAQGGRPQGNAGELGDRSVRLFR